jgi:dihydroxyacetone kinase DhaKLM complex PTS-EIIA-like component DhaM
VSTSAVFTVLSIAAHEGRHAAVVDIGGAFLNAEIKTDVDVHMRLDRTMSELMTRLRPSYAKYMDRTGCVTVMLDRALYGCVESAALWYDNLRDTMYSLGYHRNPYEMCVFKRTNDSGTPCTATMHVDDLFIVSASTEMIEHLTDGLKKRHVEIKKNQGTVLNYLGINFDLSQHGRARVSMRGYVDDVLALCDTTGGARIPATDGLFEVRKGDDMATETERMYFNSIMAKLLYLAMRDPISCLSCRILRPESADAPRTTSLS